MDVGCAPLFIRIPGMVWQITLALPAGLESLSSSTLAFFSMLSRLEMPFKQVYLVSINIKSLFAKLLGC